MTHSTLKFALACLAATAVVSPAQAQDPAPAEGQEIVVTGKLPDKGAEKRVVKIGDLNLSTDQGVKEMEKRVAAAVDDICAIASPIGYYGAEAEKPCREEGWASARPQMDSATAKARAGSGAE
jgi:UrcA family protein